MADAGGGSLCWGPAWAASTRGLLQVSKVTFDKHESGETLVDVSTSRAASYRVSTLPNPARLVVDIEDAQTLPPRKAMQPTRWF